MSIVEETTRNIVGFPPVLEQAKVQEFPEVQVTERIQELIVPEQIEELIEDIHSCSSRTTHCRRDDPEYELHVDQQRYISDSSPRRPAYTTAAVTAGVKLDTTVLVDSRCYALRHWTRLPRLCTTEPVRNCSMPRRRPRIQWKSEFELHVDQYRPFR